MKTYTGSCHCKKVQYEVDFEELKEGITCNCSICSKRGWVLTFAPTTSFRLIAGKDELTDYQFNKQVIHHLFCKNCGVASYGKGSDENGNEMMSINVRCLDNVDMDTLTVTPYNGKDL